MPIPAATLDAMLKATGSPVVFAGGATTYGRLRTQQFLEVEGQSAEYVGRHTTLLIRDGTQPPAMKSRDGLTVAGVPYHLVSIGVANADGTRLMTLVPG